MSLPILAALVSAVALIAPPDDPPRVYHGRRGDVAVAPPRVEAAITVDGALDEPVWRSAAVLTGFSQFAPKDGIPSADSTEVLVWYSPTAMHFGIRAYEPHGEVRATLSERDKIGADDYVQLLLGTFNDGRQATVFMVNPLGVQADGVLKESGQTANVSFMGAIQSRESADLRPDFVFQSKGRVTSWGYEVEVRIPFKSLRFQSAASQTWGLNITRRVQHSGYEDSWTPAQRANTSFLSQSGTLAGLTGMRRGLVLDLTPEVTDRADGAPGDDGRWTYRTPAPEVGANIRWGITNNLTLNAAVNPDFSQVEADAGQFSFDPRQALSFPEKRPFFLDGVEQFLSPNGLVYTRRMVQPIAAAKISGKLGATNIGFLSAVDDRVASTTRTDRPVFNILRVVRDLGAQGRAGVLYTDRVDGANSNRVLSFDTRLVRDRIYTAALQVAGSRTTRGGRTFSGPLWDLRLARNGRAFGVSTLLNGIDPDFRTESGFISRGGQVHALIAPRYTFFMPQGSRFESLTPNIAIDGLWFYDRFMQRGDARDKKLHLNLDANLRGGWNGTLALLLETFGYDPAYYGSLYRIAAPRSGGGVDTLPFTGTPRLPNRDYVIRVASPQFRWFSASGMYLWGQDENFYEWASADIIYFQLEVGLKPSERFRVGASYQMQEYDRKHGGGTVGLLRNPRLKLEYQATRALSARLIGEYFTESVLDLRDEGRTGYPLLRRSGTRWVPATAYRDNSFRADWLVMYQPQPGTVFYVGYGARMT
ncbi:MAG: carbohydrate binding family 9 domain-containing protein, partial [Gemmatimonadetes bacterium]|nr:carbohydrate binding family 9 domain-containing protein [Gemmatimonadota bacterium]